MTHPTADPTKLFADLKAEICKRQLSNSENFDTSVLTYAVAALGLSLGFLKDFIPVNKAQHAWMLYGSWALFTAAVVFTMTSFLLSQAGLRQQLSLAERYYIGREESAFNEINAFSKYTERANLGAGAAFLTGLVLTTLFVALNLEGAAQMRDIPKPPSGTPLGASIPDLQRLQQPDFTRGAPIPTIQLIPAAPGQTPTSTPASSPTSTPPASSPK